MVDTSYREAIRMAILHAMEKDPNVLVFGEDVAAAGGVFKVTQGLLERFGPDRVSDTPISETGLIGAAIGLAIAGFRPIAELMFADFAAIAWDQLVNQAATYRYQSVGQMNVPLVVRCSAGAGLRFGSHHSQTTESWYLPFPGLKVVAPSNSQDAYDLLLAAVSDDDPVIYLEHKSLYSHVGHLDTMGGGAAIGKARLARHGDDVSVVASLARVQVALHAADLLAEEGISAEVWDLRTISPMDIDSISKSCRRTGRLVTVEEVWPGGGWGSHLVAAVISEVHSSLLGAPVRLGLKRAPIPFSPVLEDAMLPTSDEIVVAVRAMLTEA